MTDAGDIDLGWEAFKSLLAKFVQATIGFAGIMIFTRIVDKNDFGGYFLLFSLVMISDRPIRGFANAVNKRWSEENIPHPEIFSSVFIVNILSTFIVGCVVFTFRDQLVSYTGLEGSASLFVVMFGMIATFVTTQNLLAADGHPAKSTWVDTLRSVLTLPLQIVLILGGLGALGMGYGLAGATLLTIPVTIWYVMTNPRLPSWKTLSSIWEYAKYSIPGSFVGKMYNRLDILLLGFFIGTGAVANYEVTLKLTIPAAFLSGAIGSALMPKVSNNISQGSDFTKHIENSISYVSIISIPIFFGSLAIPRHLVVTAFGGQYAEAVPFLIGLAFWRVISTQTEIYNMALYGMDHPDLNLQKSTYTLMFNIVVGVALLLAMGPIGVVIATILSEGIKYVISVHYLFRETGAIDIFPKPLQYQIVAGIVMFGSVVFANQYVVVHSFVDLLFLVGIGGIVYGSFLMVSPQIRFTAQSIYRDARGKGSSH